MSPCTYGPLLERKRWHRMTGTRQKWLVSHAEKTMVPGYVGLKGDRCYLSSKRELTVQQERNKACPGPKVPESVDGSCWYLIKNKTIVDQSLKRRNMIESIFIRKCNESILKWSKQDWKTCWEADGLGHENVFQIVTDYQTVCRSPNPWLSAMNCLLGLIFRYNFVVPIISGLESIRWQSTHQLTAVCPYDMFEMCSAMLFGLLWRLPL